MTYTITDKELEVILKDIKQLLDEWDYIRVKTIIRARLLDEELK